MINMIMIIQIIRKALIAIASVGDVRIAKIIGII